MQKFMQKQDEEKKLTNNEIAKSIMQFSQIFEENQVPDHLASTKNNILLILLCFTVYSLFILFRDYLDTIILAFLSGVAYKQLRDQFIKLWMHDPNHRRAVNGKTIMTIIIQSILFFLLPWVRYQSKKPFAEIDFSYFTIYQSFVYSTNPVIRIAQAYLFIQIIYGLFGDKLDKWLTFQKMTKTKRNVLSWLFAVITVITAILVVTTVAVVLTIEIGRASSLATSSLQNAYNCEFNPTPGSFAIPCAQKISANLSFYLPKIQNQTQYRFCVKAINDTELNYLGYDIFEYEQSLCAFEQQIKSISPNFIESVTIKQTGALLASVFGIIARLFNIIIDVSFSISTFLAIFMMTVNYFEFTSQHIYVFGQSKAKLVDSITNIISATVFIALQHLALGVILFQIFRFSQINTILSIFLSVIAFIPLVKPSLLVLLIAPAKIWLSGSYLTPTVCCLLYAYFSSLIYEKYYSKVSLHIVIINLSVIFGIYQYGVTGIFYGPLLITLFQCVYNQLFRHR